MVVELGWTGLGRIGKDWGYCPMSFRAHPMSFRRPHCHSERNTVSFRAQPHVIPSGARNLSPRLQEGVRGRSYQFVNCDGNDWNVLAPPFIVTRRGNPCGCPASVSTFTQAKRA